MARRWLPPNVTAFKDRHGKTRYRFRQTGKPSCYLHHAPGTPSSWQNIMLHKTAPCRRPKSAGRPSPMTR
jgi:hypothetical protein